mgnify:CR=1 FL=1
MHDLGTARRAGAAANGHGRRSSFRQRVRPRLGCTYLAAGRRDPAEAFEGLTRGIHVRRIETASVDTGRGLATFRVTDADRIVEGRLEAPLQPFLIEVSDIAQGISGYVSTVPCKLTDAPVVERDPEHGYLPRFWKPTND